MLNLEFSIYKKEKQIIGMLKHMPLWVLIRALNHSWSLSGHQKREDHYTEERYEGKNDCVKASVCGKQLEYCELCDIFLF